MKLHISLLFVVKQMQTYFAKKTSTPISMPVGRWRREECPVKTNQKVDWSNEDHCGPCGNQEKYLKKDLNIPNVRRWRDGSVRLS
jgi:hypothetical protein